MPINVAKVSRWPEAKEKCCSQGHAVVLISYKIGYGKVATACSAVATAASVATLLTQDTIF